MAKWAEIPGLGDDILTEMSEAVADYRVGKGANAMLAAYRDKSEDIFEAMGDGLFDIDGLTVADFNPLGQRFEDLSAQQRTVLARLGWLTLAEEYADDLIDEGIFGLVGKQASLTVVARGLGVVGGRRDDAFRQRLQVSGTIVHTRISRLSTFPILGGQLEGPSRWGNRKINGLVDPGTGEPRVTMIISERPKK